jgi:hypothetical protein
MHDEDPRVDYLPSTATAQVLHTATIDRSGPPIEASTCAARKHIVADPDAPDAPTCSGRRYIVADPDAPDAPTCKPRRYIVAPDTGITRQGAALPQWAQELGETLATRHR